MSGGARRALAVVAAAGPVLLIVLTLVLGATWPGYDAIRDTQSELGAVDAPAGSLMNVAGFMGIGVSILAFAALYAATLRASSVTWLATGVLVVAGAGMITVGFFPCDAGCVDVTATGASTGCSALRPRSGCPPPRCSRPGCSTTTAGWACAGRRRRWCSAWSPSLSARRSPPSSSRQRTACCSAPRCGRCWHGWAWSRYGSAPGPSETSSASEHVDRRLDQAGPPPHRGHDSVVGRALETVQARPLRRQVYGLDGVDRDDGPGLVDDQAAVAERRSLAFGQWEAGGGRRNRGACSRSFPVRAPRRRPEPGR